MNKIIKVSMDLKVTVHDFPEGTMQEQHKQLCSLIGNGCCTIENVKPKRLYLELGHSTRPLYKDSKCISMLVDEGFLFKDDLQPNLIGSYLYETDKHSWSIMGNILFVGNMLAANGGIQFTGIEQETFKQLFSQLVKMSVMHEAVKEEVSGV